jgi:hypothetical protein
MTKKWSEIRAKHSKLSPERQREVDDDVRRELKGDPTPQRGYCRHSFRDDGSPRELLCARGKDVRAHVGGDNFGWGFRCPCTPIGRDDQPEVPCPEREGWSDVEVEEWQGEFDAAVAKMLAGECPHCDAKLEQKEGDGSSMVCPKGCDVAADIGAGLEEGS